MSSEEQILEIAVQAPSNIAWIKYMGKRDKALNLAENPSLSLTLNRLATALVLSKTQSTLYAPRGGSIDAPPRGPIELVPLPSEKARSYFPDLKLYPQAFSEASQTRFLKQMQRILEHLPAVFEEFDLGFDAQWFLQGVRIESANAFPASAGVASSASSFAALTLATALASAMDRNQFEALYQDTAKSSRGILFRTRLAAISRQGSGSSSRSWMGPFVAWDVNPFGLSSEDSVRQVTHGFSSQDLTHFVLLVSKDTKEVSSSQAHERVKSSPLWEGRTIRTQKRFQLLQEAIGSGNWSAISRTVWQEFWEMHSLFHSAQPPFTYWKPDTLRVLQEFQKYFEQTHHEWCPDFGVPVVTMDAGANVHLTVQTEFAERWRTRIGEMLPASVGGESNLLEDRIFSGPQGPVIRKLHSP